MKANWSYGKTMEEEGSHLLIHQLLLVFFYFFTMCSTMWVKEMLSLWWYLSHLQFFFIFSMCLHSTASKPLILFIYLFIWERREKKGVTQNCWPETLWKYISQILWPSFLAIIIWALSNLLKSTCLPIFPAWNTSTLRGKKRSPAPQYIPPTNGCYHEDIISVIHFPLW